MLETRLAVSLVLDAAPFVICVIGQTVPLEYVRLLVLVARRPQLSILVSPGSKPAVSDRAGRAGIEVGIGLSAARTRSIAGYDIGGRGRRRSALSMAPTTSEARRRKRRCAQVAIG